MVTDYKDIIKYLESKFSIADLIENKTYLKLCQWKAMDHSEKEGLKNIGNTDNRVLEKPNWEAIVREDMIKVLKGNISDEIRGIDNSRLDVLLKDNSEVPKWVKELTTDTPPEMRRNKEDE